MSLVQRREGIEVALYPFYTREKEKMMVTFKSDVSKRKRLFTPASFAHPAKMHLGMLLWIIGKYTKPGETVLDPMAGAGSTMLATRYGRNVVLVELEQKFVDMMAGYDCGGKIIGYKEVEHEEIKAGWVIDVEDGYWYSEPFATKEEAEKFIKDGAIKSVLTAWKGTEQVEISHQEYVPEWIDKIPQTKCGKTEQHEPHRVPGNWERIKTLPKTKYGLGDCQIVQGDARNLTGILVDKIITSPPYSGGIDGRDRSIEPNYDEDREKKYAGGSRASIMKSYSNMPDNIGNLPYGQIDKIITSPPYENQIHKGTGEWSQSPEGRLLGGEQSAGGKLLGVPQGEDYIKSKKNIGNLKSDSYLSAMLQVYAQCYEVLKPNGLMILVTKDFIRNKQRVFLSIDTIKLCEQVGFVLEDWHERKLTQQSFWRIIYYQKHPEVEKLLTEDILVFKKEEGEGKVDTIISSPPYASEQTDNRKVLNKTILDHKGMGQGYREGYNEDNIARLPYGQIDAIITSPPYAETATGSPEMTEGDKQHRSAIGRNPDSPGSGYPRAYSANPSNIGNLPYGGSK